MTSRLRVGLDGRAFDSPAAGVRRYVRELSRALLALGEPLTLVSLGGNPVSSPGLEHVGEPWHPPTNIGWSMVGVMRAARRAAVDVYHAPAYTAPPFGIRRLVITLHDVSYERHPEWYPHRRDRVRRAFYRASAKAADVVITDSEFSRREIVAAYGIAGERIRVIPLGVAEDFVPAAGTSVPGVTSPYVLHVGDLHTRRNLEVALEAVIGLRARGGVFQHLTLVTAGLDRGLLPVLQRRASDAGQHGALTMLGHVDEDTLVRLYQGALALVYPSRYEGFGLPLVEAMASGTPVLAADASTSHEIIGEAGLCLPVDNVAAWEGAIAGLVESPVMREDLRQRGLHRAQMFTWRRTAEATYSVYRECAAK